MILAVAVVVAVCAIAIVLGLLLWIAEVGELTQEQEGD